MLGILDGTGYEKGGSGSASSIHYLAEAMRRAYADRNEYVGDPDFVKVPIAGLLDPAYLARLRALDRSASARRRATRCVPASRQAPSRWRRRTTPSSTPTATRWR